MATITSTTSHIYLTYNYDDESFYGDTIFSVDVTPVNTGDTFTFTHTTGISEITITDSHMDGPDFTTYFLVLSVDPITFDLDNGTYYANVTMTYDGEPLVIPVSLSVINKDGGGGEPEPPIDPTNYGDIKYFLEYTNVTGVEFKLDIYERGFEGDATYVMGYFTHKYQPVKDLHESVVSSNVSIAFDVDANLDLNDLYSEVEQHNLVKGYRNNQLIFVGFIKPDGIYQDYVSNRWVLDVDAFDGLSTLKNLSFVAANGTFFQGKTPIITAIKGCLDRTGLFLPINVSVNLEHDGVLINDSILESTIINTERYYQDPKKVMDCESVLSSLLEIFNATLHQRNGEWFINRRIDLITTTEFKKYVDGIYDSVITINPNITIGSHVNGFPIHHCNANQKISIAASVQAFRIHYKYGNVKSLAQNSDLVLSGTGLTADGWTINNVGGYVSRQLDGSGIRYYKNVGSGTSVGALISLNQSIEVLEQDSIDIAFGMDLFYKSPFFFSIMINISTENFTWRDYTREWVAKTPGTSFDFATTNHNGGLTLNVNIPFFPEDSELEITFTLRTPDSAVADLFLNSIEVSPSGGNLLKGQYFNAQRKTRISSVTKDDLEVFNGDSESDLFVGTLYQSDGDTPTLTWNREGFTDNLQLLEINGIDNLRISPRPMKLFEGDVYGYFPYLSFISIDGQTGHKFQPIEYSYNTVKGIITLQSKEFENADLPLTKLRNGEVEIEDDFGNVTTVTIKG